MTHANNNKIRYPLDFWPGVCTPLGLLGFGERPVAAVTTDAIDAEFFTGRALLAALARAAAAARAGELVDAVVFDRPRGMADRFMLAYDQFYRVKVPTSHSAQLLSFGSTDARMTLWATSVNDWPSALCHS